MAAAWLVVCAIFGTPSSTADDAPAADHRLESIALGGVEARGAALLLSGQNGGAVEGAVLWMISPPADDSSPAAVDVVIELAGRDLLASSTAPRVPVELYGYLVDGDGAVVGHLSQGLLVDVRRDGGAIAGAGLKFTGELRAMPGLCSLRVLVRNRQSGQFFLARTDLEVPDFTDPGLYLLPPLTAQPAARWVIAAPAGFDPRTVFEDVPGLDALPAAWPVWYYERPLELVVGGPPLAAGERLAAKLVDPYGRVVVEPRLAVDPSSASRGGVVFHRVTVTPVDVPQGDYRLVITLSDAETGRSVFQTLPVVVDNPDAVVAWTGRASAARSGDPVLPVDEPDQDDEGNAGKREIVEGYGKALRLLADGNDFEARRAVADIEARAVATPSARAWRRLRDAEFSEIARLVRKTPDSVLAVALLHRDLYPWYAARRRFGLAEHSWSVASELADWSGRQTDWSPPPGFAENLLLDMAGDLAQSGQIRSARAVLERAVALAPDNPSVLLGLGALYERIGDPVRTVQHLERLVELRPHHDEATLRLAVNRIRLGAEKAAERLLNSLIGRPAAEWTRTLAFQELARLLIAQQRLDEAERLLRNGIGEIPRNQRLRVLLALVLDLEGRPQQAETVIDELTSSGLQLATSPRVRYSAWPDLDPETARAALDGARAVGLAGLREALE